MWGLRVSERETVRQKENVGVCVWVCVCVCVRARARVCVCVFACVRARALTKIYTTGKIPSLEQNKTKTGSN